MQHEAARAYVSIDHEIVWATTVNKLDPLREAVLKILKAEYPDFEPEK